jgi:hypothetical protein
VEGKTTIKHEIRVLESHTSVQQEEVNLRLVPKDTNHLQKCLFGFPRQILTHS